MVNAMIHEKGILNSMPMSAAIFSREVCDVCLNCEKPECDHMIDGCEAYRAAMARNKGKQGPKGKRGSRE